MDETPKLTDFPKIESPFIRKNFRAHDRKKLEEFVRANRWRVSGDGLAYLVTPEVTPGFEWVFDDPDTLAIEKLDGSNFKVRVEGMRIICVQNRLNPPIDLLKVQKGFGHVADGILFAIDQGYITKDGEYAGELVGPKLQGNPYALDHHEWQPIDRLVDSLQYKSFHKYPKTFENLEAWFKDQLKSLFYGKRHKVDLAQSVLAEGVVFHNPKRKAAGQWPCMAKLRRDMWPAVYRAAGIEYDPTPVEGPEQD